MLKLLRGVMIVRNNIITIARGILCFFILTTLLGFLWSAGSMPFIEYIIWALIILSMAYGVYTSRPENYLRKNKKERIIFILGATTFFIAAILSHIKITTGPSIIVFIIIFIPFVIVFFMSPDGPNKAD